MNSQGREAVSVELTEIVLDAANAEELGTFYHRLLGGELTADEPSWVVLRAEGRPTLAFAGEETYVRPVWPSTGDDQQMMLHLDFRVEDLNDGVAFAVSIGAELAEFQPQDDVRVLLDPAGHPFCLWVEA